MAHNFKNAFTLSPCSPYLAVLSYGQSQEVTIPVVWNLEQNLKLTLITKFLQKWLHVIYNRE